MDQQYQSKMSHPSTGTVECNLFALRGGPHQIAGIHHGVMPSFVQS